MSAHEAGLGKCTKTTEIQFPDVPLSAVLQDQTNSESWGSTTGIHERR